MRSSENIIQQIDDFYITAPPEAIQEVQSALETDIPDDIPLEEYIAELSQQNPINIL